MESTKEKAVFSKRWYLKMDDKSTDQMLMMQEYSDGTASMAVTSKSSGMECEFQHEGIRSNGKYFFDLSDLDEAFNAYLSVKFGGDSLIVSTTLEKESYELGVFCNGIATLEGKYLWIR